MPQHRIHPVPHKGMALLPLDLHRMVEIRPRLLHRQRANRLPTHHQRDSQNDLPLDPVDGRGQRSVSIARAEGVREQTLGDGRAVRGVVGPAVRGEEVR